MPNHLHIQISKSNHCYKHSICIHLGENRWGVFGRKGSFHLYGSSFSAVSCVSQIFVNKVWFSLTSILTILLVHRDFGSMWHFFRYPEANVWITFTCEYCVTLKWVLEFLCRQIPPKPLTLHIFMEQLFACHYYHIFLQIN